MTVRPGARRPAGVRARRCVPLPPEAASAGQARRALREVLVQTGEDRWLEAAELACTELVSNAVLHAHTAITLTIEVGVDELRVDVHDLSPALPLQRSYDTQATTGRGMTLVAALASDHGISDAGPHGKTVWFTLRGDPGGQSELDLLAAWDDADWALGGDDLTGSATPADRMTGTAPAGRTVTLLSLPPTLWLAAREHHDALLRELVLYLAEHDGPAVDLAATARARATLSEAVSAAVEHARQTGTARPALPAGHPSSLPWVPEALDLPLEVPAGLAAGFSAMQDTLDVAERLALDGRLLAGPGLPEIVAVRDWACEQVVAQHAGVRPAPWPGADQERFTTDVHAPRDERVIDWDVGATRDAERGLVAADEANRIVAVSGPLARLVGWAPDDLVGRRVVTLIPPRLREGHVAGFSRYLSSGEAHLLGVPLTLPVLHADGTELLCRFLIEKVATDRGRPVFLAWVDPLDAATP